MNMNTNTQTQKLVEYVRVNTRQPTIWATLVGDSANEITVKEGSKVFFNKDYTHTLQDDTVIQINITVVDVEEGSGDYVVAIGGEVKDHIVDGFTRDWSIDVAYSAQLVEVLKSETSLPSYLRNTSLFIKTPRIIRDHDRDRRPTERIRDRSDREREAMDSIQELLCSHLDDIITQANILKTTDQRVVKSDAYARMQFAMARLERLEQTSVYDIKPRYMTHGDASPESMERLRHDRDIAERERELNPLNDRDPRGYFRDDRRHGRREDRDDCRGGYSRG